MASVQKKSGKSKGAGKPAERQPASELMTPEQWEKAIAKAEASGPLYAELVRLSRRFDNELGAIGHGVATSLTVLGIAGQNARTSLEVHVLTKRFLGALIGTQIDVRLDHAIEGGAL